MNVSQKRSESFLEHISELLFTLLPFVMLLIIYWSEGKTSAILGVSEWAIASSILFGQSLVKFAAGMSRIRVRRKFGVVRIFMTLIMFFGLVPSLTFVFISVSEHRQFIESTNIFSIAQIFLFFVSMIVFLVVGVAADEVGRVDES